MQGRNNYGKKRKRATNKFENTMLGITPVLQQYTSGSEVAPRDHHGHLANTKI